MEDNPECQTSIEGYYHSKSIYTGKVPVLFKKKWDKRSIQVYGQILEIKDNGFFFIPEKTGDTTFYDYQKVDALINSNNKLMYGKVPEKYLDDCVLTLIMFNHSEPEKELYEIELEPNEQFGFCLNAGKYQARSILFKNEHDFIDSAINFDTLMIDVKKGYNNYVGDFYLDNQEIEGQRFVLPYKNIRNPVAATGGSVFGAVGAVMGGLLADYVDKKSVHEITLINNQNFKSLNINKLITSLIYKKE